MYTTVSDNRFCDTAKPVESEPLVTNTREAGTLMCPFQDPVLAIAPAVQLTWLFDGTGYRIESAASADGPWSDLGLTASVTDGKSLVTVPVSAGSRFFRLRRP